MVAQLQWDSLPQTDFSKKPHSYPQRHLLKPTVDNSSLVISIMMCQRY